MSDASDVPSTVDFAFNRPAQIARATVHKDRIVFEIQAPDASSAPLYAGALESAFEYRGETSPMGNNPGGPPPVKVKVDEHDKTKVIATFAPDMKSRLNFASATAFLRLSFEDAHKMMDRTYKGRMGIHISDAVGDDIREAVDALEELNGHERDRILAKRLGSRGTGSASGGRSF